jgi:hypothetical protein
MKKWRGSYWITVGVLALMGVGVYLAISDHAQKEAAARQLEIERSVVRAIDHMCAQWKTDRPQFSACGEAFRMYEKCEAGWSRMLEHEGITNDAGIACEHPIYQFHAREQKEIEDVKRSQRF